MYKITIVLFLSFLLCQSFHTTKPIKPGEIILSGGGSIPLPVVNWIKKRAPIGKYLVITCYPDSKDKWIKLFENAIFILPEDFAKTSLINISAIIITGGDQFEYINRLSGKAIQNAHEKGVLIMGSSAGAMILGEFFFSAEKGTITSEEACRNERVCLGSKFVTIKCLKGIIVDTHFQAREREARLKIFIEKSGAEIGIGIDEDTALCIDGNQFCVLGEGSVKFYPNRNTVNRSVQFWVN